MAYDKYHSLLLFEDDTNPKFPERGHFHTPENIAILRNGLNYLSKNRALENRGSLFINREVVDSRDLPNTLIVLGSESQEMGVITRQDHLIIIGHGDLVNGQVSEYKGADLAAKLYDWGLENVKVIYLCACQMGVTKNYADKFAAGLHGLTFCETIRAPKGYVEIDIAGHKNVTTDEAKTNVIPKGQNKIVVDSLDTMMKKLGL
jgi:hypothetical protein